VLEHPPFESMKPSQLPPFSLGRSGTFQPF
jgi:hypothetical protein